MRIRAHQVSCSLLPNCRVRYGTRIIVLVLDYASVCLREINSFQAQNHQFLWKVAVFSKSCIWRGEREKSRDFGKIAKNRDRAKLTSLLIVVFDQIWNLLHVLGYLNFWRPVCTRYRVGYVLFNAPMQMDSVAKNSPSCAFQFLQGA